MHDTASVEAILSRLMPPALSEAAQSDIETMLDNLAPDEVAGIVKPSRPRIWPVVSGIAAALALLAVIPFTWRASQSSEPGQVAALNEAPFEWLSETDRVEAISDDGWSDSPEGGAMRAMRMRVVEEDRLLDVETGIVMRISAPRDELLLMPMSAF